MRQLVYERIARMGEEGCGYVTTGQLLAEGVTNRQIALLTEEGYLERIANGRFWMPRSGKKKPADYRAVEAAFVNPEVIICADSALYLNGYVKKAPEVLSIATRRNDRHQMKFPFEVTRHYYAEKTFTDNSHTVTTAFGEYQVYDNPRSICDLIRFRETVDPDVFEQAVTRYRRERKDFDKMMEYARAMRAEARVLDVIGKPDRRR